MMLLIWVHNKLLIACIVIQYFNINWLLFTMVKFLNNKDNAKVTAIHVINVFADNHSRVWEMGDFLLNVFNVNQLVVYVILFWLEEPLLVIDACIARPVIFFLIQDSVNQQLFVMNVIR